MHRFHKRAYRYNLKHFIRPDLRSHGRLEFGYGYVDGDGNPVQLKDDVNPEKEEDSPVETDGDEYREDSDAGTEEMWEYHIGLGPGFGY
jgi:hypothetical protein